MNQQDLPINVLQQLNSKMYKKGSAKSTKDAGTVELYPSVFDWTDVNWCLLTGRKRSGRFEICCHHHLHNQTWLASRQIWRICIHCARRNQMQAPLHPRRAISVKKDALWTPIWHRQCRTARVWCYSRCSLSIFSSFSAAIIKWSHVWASGQYKAKKRPFSCSVPHRPSI